MISQQQLKALLQEQKIGLSAPEVLVELPEGPIFHVLIKGGSHALDQWQQARGLISTTGLYPVIVGSKEEMMTEILAEQVSPEVEMAEIVRQAQEMDAMQVLANGLYYQEINNTGEWREWPLLSENGSGRIPVEVFSAADPRTYLPWIEEILGPWPENIDPEESSGRPQRLALPEGLETVSLCLLPVEQGWQVPALLGWGGWNECPLPVEHSCVHLYWHNSYGAEIICLAGDLVELFVPHPPTTSQECRKLALEHFAYSADTLYQEDWLLRDYVAHLSGNQFWFFWWD